MDTKSGKINLIGYGLRPSLSRDSNAKRQPNPFNHCLSECMYIVPCAEAIKRIVIEDVHLLMSGLNRPLENL